MIGLYRSWNEAEIDPPRVDRFTRSLAAGVDMAVGHHAADGILLATHCRGAARARAWRPACTPCGARVLFTGYFDAPDAVRRELGMPGAEAGGDDAAVYAAGYARWGDAVDRTIGGQFATIMVRPGEPRVRLARSPLHAPPLHYWHDRTHVIVASTARVLFATGDLAPTVDEQKIADSLYLNYAEEERDWYSNVRRAPVGAHVVIAPAGATARLHYDVSTLPSVRLKTDRDYVDAANALLAEGTRAALHGFARPAVSLSGGLDSQAVAAMTIATRPGTPVLGLTSVPEAGWDGVDHPSRFGDERAHVAALAALYPTLETEAIDAAGLSFDHKLAAMFLMAGSSPRHVMNLHWIHAVRARAKARGCDVLLVGARGNASFSFSGSGALPGWFARGAWGRLRRELQHVRGDRSLARAFAAQALLPFVPDAAYRGWMRWRAPDHVPDPLDSWCALDPDYAREMQVEERALAMGHDVAFRQPRSTLAARVTMLGQTSSETGDNRQALDLIHGIPARDPTAYRPLLEFCLGIPDDQYLRDGQARWLARRMLRGTVPDMVVDERRRGLQASDWPLRIARDRTALLAELARLQDDPAMARRLALPKLIAALEAWSPHDDQRGAGLIQHAIPRAIATARFVRFVEGSNAG